MMESEECVVSVEDVPCIGCRAKIEIIKSMSERLDEVQSALESVKASYAGSVG